MIIIINYTNNMIIDIIVNSYMKRAFFMLKVGQKTSYSERDLGKNEKNPFIKYSIWPLFAPLKIGEKVAYISRV